MAAFVWRCSATWRTHWLDGHQTVQKNLHSVLHQAYHLAQNKYQRVILVESPTLEEQTYWDATLAQFTSTSDAHETTAALKFVELPDHLTAYAVPNRSHFAADSPLRYFLDGAQRTRLLFVADTIPVCITICGVALVERPQPGGPLVERRLTPCLRLALLLPDAPSVRPLWEAFQAEGLQPQDTLTPQYLQKHNLTRDELVTQFDLCRYFAYQRARHLRQELEKSVITAWVQAKLNGWLVLDGDIRHLGTDILGAALVGIIKRHRYPYFRGPSQALLLSLPAYYRTNLFMFSQTATHSVQVGSSFFLRWRRRRLQDGPEYGLLRIETPLALPPDQANLLSRWLIAEGSPAETGRNGNHLYPIARAERLAKKMVQDHWRSLPRHWAR